MSTLGRLKFSGRLDRSAAEAAFQTAALRHPLLLATIRKGRRGRLEWVAAESGPPRLQWHVGSCDGPFPPVRGLDLFAEPGLRGWGIEDGDRGGAVFQIHHACADGVGGLQFIEDFLIAYAEALGGPAPRGGADALDPALLRTRGTFGLTAWKGLRILPAQLTGLLGARQFLMRRPATLLAHEPSPADPLPAGYPAVLTRRLAAEELRALKLLAVRDGVTLNERLIRDLFIAVNDFQTRHQPAVEAGWLRFSVPVNLREAKDRRLPAANVVSMVFLDRQREQIADPGRLLASVHDELELIRRRRLGLTFIWSLYLLRALPGGLRGMTAGDRCAATCVVSNLGTLLRRTPLPHQEGRVVAGNVVLEEMELLAPLRPGTAAAFLVFGYAHALYVTMHYDPRRLTAEQAGDLLDTFERQVRRAI
jgi:hypothetical protein